MSFGSDLCHIGFSADQAADVMHIVRSDRRRELFLRNFEILISLPLPFDQAVRAAIWSTQDDWAAITGHQAAQAIPLAGPDRRRRRKCLLKLLFLLDQCAAGPSSELERRRHV
jgi:hypothetical protein